MKETKLPDFDHYSSLFDYTIDDHKEAELKEKQVYTKKIDGLIYEPKGAKPSVYSLIDCDKTDQLLDAIEESDLDTAEKRFLIKAACRHYVFNYERIAEYYCHASKEMQKHMEDSALVIIDFDSAIEGGYVEFSEKMKQVWFETWGKKKPAETTDEE